ncbi:MAG: glutathione S-transferase family protein [Pseudomonadota bacterium]
MIRLVIGNKNYSSWSLRGWLAVKLSGLPFEEELLPLDTPAFKNRIGALSPSKLVPVLHDGDVIIWDSLAMVEYLNERVPGAGFWPEDRAARAFARSIAAEMHSGFGPMRDALPMNIRKHFPGHPVTPAVQANINRIQDIWTDCLERSKGTEGGFLFGSFGAADIMFAPVVHRFKTYDVTLRPAATAYIDAMLAQPFMAEWADAGRAETWIVEADEV